LITRPACRFLELSHAGATRRVRRTLKETFLGPIGDSAGFPPKANSAFVLAVTTRARDLIAPLKRYGVKIDEPIRQPGVKIPDPDWGRTEPARGE
jgi:hypothetical protein